MLRLPHGGRLGPRGLFIKEAFGEAVLAGFPSGFLEGFPQVFQGFPSGFSV